MSPGKRKDGKSMTKYSNSWRRPGALIAGFILMAGLWGPGCGAQKDSAAFMDSGNGDLAHDIAAAHLEGFTSWTKNPSLDKDTGLWWTRTFCWSIGVDCPNDLLLSKAVWEGDGSILLRAEDDNTGDAGCDCAAMTQGTGMDGSVRGHPLERIRTGDVEAGYIIFQRSQSAANGCMGIAGAGNIINLWLRHPDGSIWVTDLYFETRGLDSGFKERPGPHNMLVSLFSPLPWERGNDWYAYQVNVPRHPQYRRKTAYADGSELWVIDLKALLDRGAEFSGRDLADYLWCCVDVVSEDICIGGRTGQSFAEQRVHYFEILVQLKN